MMHVPAKSFASRHPLGWWLMLLGAGMVACLMMTRRALGDQGGVEDQVKSAFIVNFVQFVDWPDKTFAKADDPIVVGCVDSDAMAQALQAAVEGKTVKGHKLVFKRLTAQNAAGCQVLYVGPGAGDAAAILKTAGEGPILTIGEGDGFVNAGGVISFYIEDRKERFEINTAAADRAHLQVSSKLLKLAKVMSK